MAQLEEATRRLQSAIERLDRAVVARVEQSGGGQGEGLREALEQKAQENARLQAVAAEAGERIDTAISRLKVLLGE